MPPLLTPLELRPRLPLAVARCPLGQLLAPLLGLTLPWRELELCLLELRPEYELVPLDRLVVVVVGVTELPLRLLLVEDFWDLAAAVAVADWLEVALVDEAALDEPELLEADVVLFLDDDELTVEPLFLEVAVAVPDEDVELVWLEADDELLLEVAVPDEDELFLVTDVVPDDEADLVALELVEVDLDVEELLLLALLTEEEPLLLTLFDVDEELELLDVDDEGLLLLTLLDVVAPLLLEGVSLAPSDIGAAINSAIRLDRNMPLISVFIPYKCVKFNISVF